MANKLSITEVRVNQGLAQIKTGELFVVTSVDLDAKKAILRSPGGEEKVVSKATLERWYRELTEEEGGKVSSSSNEKEVNDDALSKSNESETSASDTAGENANDADKNDEAESTSNNSDDLVSKLREAYGHQSSDAGVSGDSGDSIANAINPDIEAEFRNGTDKDDSESGAGDAEGVGSDEQVVGSGNENGGSSSESGTDTSVASPVTPSNAGKDKDKAKSPKKQEPKNAALMKVRQTIIDTILADSSSIQLKTTSSYDVLKEKHNFAEITHGSNRFNVSVMSKCLTEDQLNKVKVNPASFGWSIDADFTVFDESDIETAVQLIRQSREYRLANPVVRKKKETTSKK